MFVLNPHFKVANTLVNGIHTQYIIKEQWIRVLGQLSFPQHQSTLHGLGQVTLPLSFYKNEELQLAAVSCDLPLQLNNYSASVIPVNPFIRYIWESSGNPKFILKKEVCFSGSIQTSSCSKHDHLQILSQAQIRES